jgi:tetratricopeptide (TPR) repeat protein
MRGLALILAVGFIVAAPAAADPTREPDGAVTAPAVRLSPSEIRADRLDRLFARLHGLADGQDSRSIEQDIWTLWMASDSPTAEALLQQATRAMNEGAFEPSLAILDRLVGAFPGFAEAWNKRATLYFMMGRYPESLADIDRVLDLEPRHFGALSGRGMIYQRLRNYTAALAAYREALDMNPAMRQVREAVKALERYEQGI